MTATSTPRGAGPAPRADAAVPAGCTPATGPDAVRADPVAEAFRSWMRVCSRAGWSPDPVVETVEVRHARNRVTAGPVTARWSVPAYRAAAMDGIAVADRDLASTFPQVLGPEAHAWVDTGDALPATADRVVVREIVTSRPDGSVEIVERPTARHVRPVGEDMEAGAVVLPAGHRIRPVDVAAVAAAGHVGIAVRRRPRVAIVPTGDEIRPVGSSLLPGEILDTNSLVLEGLLAEAGCESWVLPVVPDVPDELAAAIAGAAHTADVVLVLAGSSAGRDDHTGSVIARLGRVAVQGVAVRPGHPVVLGVLGGEAPETDGHRPASPPVPVVGVPGYPASAERAFDGFVAPLVRRVLGVESVGTRPVAARLAAAVGSPARLDEYVRVRLATVTGAVTAAERLVAVPLPRGAGALSTLTRAEALLRVPVGVGGLPAGAEVEVVPVPGAAFAAGTTIVAGAASAVVDALVEVHRAGAPACLLHRSELTAGAALDALAAGLCHTAVTILPLGAAHDAAAESLAGRLGPITVLEIARSADGVHTLVVPAAAFDSAPVVELRSTLRSMPFRRRLRDVPGCSGRSSGRETWYAPADDAPVRHVPAAHHGVPGDPPDGGSRCATR